MPNEEMRALGSVRSVIRDIFEYAGARKASIGEENVFDFSLGNPSIPTPERVTKTIRELLTRDPVSLHGYTSAPGAANVREAVASSINRRFERQLTPDLIYMTCGAAASLTISLHALLTPGDEVVGFAPYFPEYKVFVEGAGGVFVPLPPNPPAFDIDLAALERALTPRTRAVILNSPNNPSGVVISQENLSGLCDILRAAERKTGAPIYLLADEPYRELVYDGVTVPYPMNFYRDTLVLYSYSKSLSLPGERIGYIAVSEEAAEREGVCAAVAGAGRALGYVCAPSLFQQVVAACVDVPSDIAAYEENRALLLGALSSYGYDIVPPEGAFYLFMRSPEPDASAFCERAKERELLLVPADSFGAPGYVRISYCVSKAQIERSLPAFRALAREYDLPGA